MSLPKHIFNATGIEIVHTIINAGISLIHEANSTNTVKSNDRGNDRGNDRCVEQSQRKATITDSNLRLT